MLRSVLRKQLPPVVAMASEHSAVVPSVEELDGLSQDWRPYFDQLSMVSSERAVFAVYQSYCRTPAPSVPTFFLVHGAGHTSLSWAHMVPLLREHARVVAVDLRGHGLSHCPDQDPPDLSLDALVADCAAVLATVELVQHPSLDAGPAPLERLVVVGHSMGGAIATHLCASKRLPVAGLVVIDVVEGTALESLAHIKSILQARPPAFPSCAHAVRWALCKHMPKNPDAARLSIPSQLIYCSSIDQSTISQSSDQSTISQSSSDPSTISQSSSDQSTISQSSSDPSSISQDESTISSSVLISQSSPSESESGVWKWRVDLLSSEQYWQGWYRGMSQTFLNCGAQKLLILAGTDRLDKTLLIGQMQGKFQLELLPQAGHCVHEDQPSLTAHHLLAFISRYHI